MRERMTMAMLFPLLAVLVIVIFAGGLGVIFIFLDSTALEQWAVVILGLALLIGVPTTAALLQRRVEGEEPSSGEGH